jgi:hypothetical protein
MGSHAVTYAVVALAIAVACLIAGFLWGRSNVRAQIEDAVEKEHVALDAREFAMRTQLEDAIAENAKLRPLAEELGRVQKRLEQEQAKYACMKSDFNASYRAAQTNPSPEADEPSPADAPASADEAIHKLLQSLEVFNAPETDKPVPSKETNPAPVAPISAAPDRLASVPTPAAAPVQPVAKPLAIPEFKPTPKIARPTPPPPVPAISTPTPAAAKNPAPQIPVPAAASGNPAPPPPRKPVPTDPAKPSQPVDEWQEFARQLEALTGKKK